MSINEDIQKLEPGALVDLWELDGAPAGGGVAFFQAISASPVLWQGNSYVPWPIEATGFARTSDQQPFPTLRVGDVDGSIGLLCALHDDMVGAVLIRHRTFAKYLDGQPGADPTQEFPPERWFVDRKAHEVPGEFVEFELSSVLDFSGVMIPRRQIIANQCPWTYRGDGCFYDGPPVATVMDQPTSDPLLDDCGRRPSSCKLRQWPDGVMNFGGFPGAGLLR